MAELKVEISADIDKLKKGLNATNRNLKQFGKNADKAVNNLKGTNSPLAGASKNMNKLGKSTANATPTLTEFSRVIQDAPFGIVGVGNNITQLVSVFGNLKNQTGSTTSALKAVVGSLAGPGGVLFAVSTAVTLFTVYGDKLFNTKKAVDELAKAQAEAIGSAQGEIAVLKSLVNIGQDESESKENRQRAIDKINDLYGDYLPNLNLETIGTEKVTKAVDALTESLIRQAKIRGIENVITQKSTELAEKNAEIINDATAETVEAFRRQTNAAKNLDPRELVAFGREAEKVNEILRNSQNNVIEGIVNEKAAEETSELNQEIDALISQLEELTRQDVQLKGIETFTKKGEVKLTPTVQAISTIEADNAIKPITTAIQKIKNSNGDTIKVRVNLEDLRQIEGSLDGLLRPVTDGSILKLQSQLQQVTTASNIFGNAATSALQSFASTVSQSLGITNEIVNAFVSSILSSLSQLLSQTITNALQQIAVNKALATSNAVQAGTQSAVATGPAAAFSIAPLIALAVGGVIAAFASLGSFNNGGFVGDNNLIRVNGDEMVLNKLQQARLFTQLNTNVPRGSLSGATAEQSSANIIPSVKLRGSDLIVAFNRAKNKNNRFGA